MIQISIPFMILMIVGLFTMGTIFGVMIRAMLISSREE